MRRIEVADMDEAVSRILSYLDAHRDELIEFVRRLIAANSENRPGDETAVAKVIVTRARELGFPAPQVFGKNDKRINLIYRLDGSGPNGYHTVLNAHMDTKPAGDPSEWRYPPFQGTIADGNLHGLGSVDMKGALGAMVYAFAAIRQLGVKTPGSLGCWFIADEEAGSVNGAKYLMEERLVTADYVIIGEPSGVVRDWEAICVVSRGISCFKIIVKGDQTHSSITDRIQAVNASEKMGYVLSQFRKRLKLTYRPHPYCPQGPTVNPGVMVNGGTTYGVNPGEAAFHCDIRTIPGMTRAQLEADLRAFMDEMMREDPELRLELEFAPAPLDWIEATEIAADAPPVQALQKASERVLGEAPPLSAFPGGTDAPFFQIMGGIPTVPSFGPGLITVAHSSREYVPVEGIIQAAKIYALAAWDMMNRVKGQDRQAV
jgi:acetylornithine deacetylase/succinyl-diaminopimelate desuccinylase family protein